MEFLTKLPQWVIPALVVFGWVWGGLIFAQRLIEWKWFKLLAWLDNPKVRLTLFALSPIYVAASYLIFWVIALIALPIMLVYALLTKTMGNAKGRRLEVLAGLILLGIIVSVISPVMIPLILAFASESKANK